MYSVFFYIITYMYIHTQFFSTLLHIYIYIFTCTLSILTVASTTLFSTFGNMIRGKRMISNRAKEVKAVATSRVWPSAMYVWHVEYVYIYIIYIYVHKGSQGRCLSDMLTNMCIYTLYTYIFIRVVAKMRVWPVTIYV
jgi:hypothetical protein